MTAKRKFFESIENYENTDKYYIEKYDFERVYDIISELKDLEYEYKTLKKLKETYYQRKKRHILGIISICIFILSFEIAIFIITKVILVNVILSLLFGIFGIIFLGIGLYLLLTNPPVYIEDEEE